MIVPEYWAEAKATNRIDGRQVTLQRFGWSDESEDAARKHAEQRLAEAVARHRSGGKPLKRERKIPYNGADGVPIREEILKRSGDIVLTRNSYGAICLNTPDVLFADVDVSERPSMRLQTFSCLLLLAVLLGAVTATGFAVEGGSLSVPLAIGAIIASALLFGPFSRLIFNLRRKINGTQSDLARGRIRSFSSAHPDWHLRVYQTPAGFRILVMHTVFSSHDHEVASFFNSIGTDRMYALMCEKQNCFRARLTPKPWRVAYQHHLKPRPGVWPINPDRMPNRLKWIEGYERACAGYAACKFVEQMGSRTVDPKAERAREVHDNRCRAHEDLPIA